MNILGTSSGRIYFAGWGVEIPDRLDALGDDWTDVGVISEDGLHTLTTPVFHGRRHWNSLTTNIQLPAGFDETVAFTPLEYSEFVTVLEHGGGTWTAGGDGIRRFDPPDHTEVPAWSVIVDAVDGTRTVRTVIERAVVTSPVDRQYHDEVTRTEVTLALASVAGTQPWWQFDNGDA